MKSKLTVTDETVALRHPDARACTVGGEVFAVGTDGVFRVPRAAVEALCDHGFAPVEKAG